MLILIDLIVTDFQQNCRIIGDSETKQAVVVDPGGETGKITHALAESDLTCEQIWLTHSHLDHCGGVKALKEMTGAVLYAHPDEKWLRANVRQVCALFGVSEREFDNCPEPDVLLRGGENLTVGSIGFKTLHTPGHSPGHLCFLNEDSKILIVGDMLFAGSVGRTDLPGGDREVLLSSIRRIVESVPLDTRVLCGHGPDTVLGAEKESNPFLKGDWL